MGLAVFLSQRLRMLCAPGSTPQNNAQGDHHDSQRRMEPVVRGVNGDKVGRRALIDQSP